MSAFRSNRSKLACERKDEGMNEGRKAMNELVEVKAREIVDLLEVKAVLDGILDRVACAAHQQGLFAMERALKLALAQLDMARRAEHQVKRRKSKGDRDKWRKERLELCSLLAKAGPEVDNLVAQLQLKDGRIGRLEKTLDALKAENEVLRENWESANRKTTLLEKQVEALFDVQQQMHEQFRGSHGTTNLVDIVSDESILARLLGFLDRPSRFSLKLVCRFTCRKIGDLRSSWSCSACGFVNSSHLPYCEQCETGRGTVKQGLWVSTAAKSLVSKIGTKIHFPPGTASNFFPANPNFMVATDRRMKRLRLENLELKTQMEDLQAKLSTFAKTKKLLVEKLQQSEKVLATVIEQRDRAKAQTASDREVIMYLDVKVQELERIARGVDNKDRVSNQF